MKKSEINEVLLYFWNNIDQAGFDLVIAKALKNCPMSIQTELLSDLTYGIDQNTTDNEGVLLDFNMIKRANKILRKD